MQGNKPNSFKSTGGWKTNDKNTRARTRAETVVYDDGETLDAEHVEVDENGIVFVYTGALQAGIMREIPLSSVRHILRGDGQ